AEPVAAFVELTLGNQWGVGGSLIVGLMQGLGAELAFALFAYKGWTNLVVLLSGALSGARCGVYYWFTNPGWGMM
ncbi:ABC transporter permease, partial [Bifidobacterium animalis subsp. lactis]|uniref:ECF transporter S component n=1 Tax=Bifidobacterium animalis TaxID=28025 RepID=UPI000DE5F2F6